jgi:hypothetical protein
MMAQIKGTSEVRNMDWEKVIEAIDVCTYSIRANAARSSNPHFKESQMAAAVVLKVLAGALKRGLS